jgi:hypothetical protein
LQGRLSELRAKGLSVAAISYDPVETLAAFSRQRGITFPLLSDAGSETIRRYGIFNTVVDEALGPHKDEQAVKEETQRYVSAVGVNPIMKGIAFPGTFIVDLTFAKNTSDRSPSDISVLAMEQIRSRRHKEIHARDVTGT